MPRHVAVIGGGTIGGGVASIMTPLVDTTIIDRDEAAAQSAASRVRSHVERLMDDGVLSRSQGTRSLARLRVTATFDAWQSVDLVIEALPENLALKQRTLQSIQPLVARQAVWATTTSALPLREITRAAVAAERVVGMHVFVPVESTRLVEVVVQYDTARDALDTVRTMAVFTGKATLVARDTPAFFTTRVLSAYLREALLLLAEGVPPRVIDREADLFGFVRPPFQLLDAIGLDVAAAVASNLANYSDPSVHRSLQSVADRGILGIKSGAGFYVYSGSRIVSANPDVQRILGWPSAAQPPRALVRKRLVLGVVNETAWAVHKRVVATRWAADVAGVLALGFPPRTGGPLRWARRRGLARVAAELEELAATRGQRFLPAPFFRLEPAAP